MKIGIFGSAFDPITMGHLWAANTAMNSFKLDRVIFVPSSESRRDKNRNLTGNMHRLNMVKAAIKGEAKFQVSNIEMIRPQEYQYTYYSMQYFKELFSSDKVYFILGADNLFDIPRWKNFEELIKENNFIVIPRGGINICDAIGKNEILDKYREHFSKVDEQIQFDISSSQIRCEFANENLPKYLIPKGSYEYIMENGLYTLNKRVECDTITRMERGGRGIMNTMQMQIIEKLQVNPSINAKVEMRKRIEFLKEYLKANSKIESLVLGLSGGQDSTLVGKLSQMAVNELNQELGEKKYKFIGVRLPYGVQRDEDDCKMAVDFIKPDVLFTVNIKPAVDASVKTISEVLGKELSDYLKGNEKARERMKVQYSIAGEYCGLVVGTDHASEAIMGFFTKFGDGAADIVPISNLNKRQGKQLLKELNCPPQLYEKVPTADLEDDRPGLPDEAAYGVTYDEIDDYLEGKDIRKESRIKIEKAYINTEHKRNSPVTIFDRF